MNVPSTRFSGKLPLALGLMALLAGPGCNRRATPKPAEDLPPAYVRDQILDPAMAETARAFMAWVDSQKAGDEPAFGKVQVLPPAPMLLPYGVGTYQKETRLPAILITGPGWRELSHDDREALAGRAFDELSRLLKTTAADSSIRPTVTIQTPQGLELGWINDREPGRTLLHGEDE